MSTPLLDSAILRLNRALAANAAPVFFRAKCGRRRQFLSQSDCDAYDAGWNTFPVHVSDAFGPFRDGWWDAHARAEEQFWSDRDVLDNVEE